MIHFKLTPIVMIPLWQVALKPQAVYNLDNIILYFVVHSGNVQAYKRTYLQYGPVNEVSKIFMISGFR